MPRWSCQFYLTADNNLFKVINRELKQFGTANPKNVNVVVQVDTPRYRARRHVLNPDGSFIALKARKGTNRNLNVGKPQTLVNFLFASKHLRQGKSTVVVLNGHGTGITNLAKVGHIRVYDAYRPGAIALGIDDSSRDFLDNNELEFALKAFRDRTKKDFHKPDIIGCDACLMGTVEFAHQLRDYATYFVASQDNESAEGWPYESILKAFNDEMEPDRAAISIVEAYDRATKRDDLATLSAVKLDLMTELATALDGLGRALLPFVTNEMPSLARARDDARTFANFDSIDLYGYVEALKKRFARSVPDNAGRRRVLAAADTVRGTLGRAVIATSKDPKVSGARGLSVYLPNSLVINAYHDLPLSKVAPGWHQFVVAYGAIRNLI